MDVSKRDEAIRRVQQARAALARALDELSAISNAEVTAETVRGKLSLLPGQGASSSLAELMDAYTTELEDARRLIDAAQDVLAAVNAVEAAEEALRGSDAIAVEHLDRMEALLIEVRARTRKAERRRAKESEMGEAAVQKLVDELGRMRSRIDALEGRAAGLEGRTHGLEGRTRGSEERLRQLEAML